MTARLNEHYLHDGQLILYQRPNAETNCVNPTWYMDINFPRQKRIRFRSTRCNEYHQASMYAETQYRKLAERVSAGIAIDTYSFRKVAKEAIDFYEDYVNVGRLSKGRFCHLLMVTRNLLIPYFDGLQKDFVEINTLDIEGFSLWRMNVGTIIPKHYVDKSYKKPSIGTINIDLSMLRKIYNYAVKREYILPNQVPEIKDLRYNYKDHRRPHFTKGEWSKVTNYLFHHYIKPTKHSKGSPTAYKFQRQLNRHYWLLLSQSFCRVGEIYNLKWGDIEIRKVRKSGEDEYVDRVLLSVDGKTGKRVVVCMPYTKVTIKRWKDICTEYSITTEPSEFVFRHVYFSSQRHIVGKPIVNTNQSFRRVLEKLNLLYDTDGKRRSIYSIRHSAITWALQRNVNITALSKNAGVSIKHIQTTYDHAITTDFIEELTKFDVTKADRIDI